MLNLEAALVNMHYALQDLRKWWAKFSARAEAAVLLELPVSQLIYYDDICRASYYDDPAAGLFGEELRDVEERVGELLQNRIFPPHSQNFWEFPTHYVYRHYKPDY